MEELMADAPREEVKTTMGCCDGIAGVETRQNLPAFDRPFSFEEVQAAPSRRLGAGQHHGRGLDRPSPSRGRARGRGSSPRWTAMHPPG